MQKQLLYLLFVALSLSVYARKTTVTTASAINNGSWAAGDTIVMKNGLWTNQSISINSTGTQLQPVVLMSETEGNVILNGSSKLAIGGSYIVVSGLYFLNGTLSGSAVVEFRSGKDATYCTLKNTAIVNYNPAINTVDSKWVSIFGKNNTVDRCSFENKTNSGTLLVVWLTSGVTVNHAITNNYFGFRNSNLDANGDELNGQEIIRVGDSSTSMTTANVTVSGNFFEKCNGEIEVISNKSCGNLYTNNLFFECKGMLTLRHGNNCTVAGNYFFGNGVSESGGVRIIGENHKVYNNYFENLKGTGYRAALCMVRGKENSALNEYYQVKNALVTFNTMVNCSQAFSINYNSSSSLTLPPINSVIAHNHVYNTNSNNNNVTIDQNYVAGMSVMWKNNLMNQGKYVDFSYNSTQVITGKDAKMTLAGTKINIYEPVNETSLSTFVTNEFNEITTDIRGRNRILSSKLPGASDINGNVTASMPEKKLVGAAFFNNPATAISTVISDKVIKYKITNNRVQFYSNLKGNLSIVNINGTCVYQTNMFPDSNYVVQLEKAAYLFSFKTENKIATKKIIIYE
jgi:poly(beta-D-mannuronate) lyase